MHSTYDIQPLNPSNPVAFKKFDLIGAEVCLKILFFYSPKTRDYPLRLLSWVNDMPLILSQIIAMKFLI